MAQIALPRHQANQGSADLGIGMPLYQRRSVHTNGPIELLPNPDFSFPMRPTEPSPCSPEGQTHSGRRPRSAQMANSNRLSVNATNSRKSVSALPDFTFNPSGAPATNKLTPPHSPLPTTPTTPRGMGHRRGGSEFIGGDGRNGATGLLSSSPTKTENVLPPPSNMLTVGPPPGRRGHAHRRSGAISCHDLSSILQITDANKMNRCGSAPVTPRDPENTTFLSHQTHKSISQPSLRSASMEQNIQNLDASPKRPPSRARVGFSDRVEYIRPLSTISSETESSISTIRGHSVSNSLSSIMSGSIPSPPSRNHRTMLKTSFEENIQSRPSTAGDVLDISSSAKDGFGGDLFSRKRPISSFGPPTPGSPDSIDTPAKPAPGKRRHFFHWDSRKDDLCSTMHLSSSEPSLVQADSESSLDSAVHMQEDDISSCPKSQSIASKQAQKPRKVKSWANSIISRKSKQVNGKPKKSSERPPTPPAPAADEPIDVDKMDFDFTANFDEDNTVTIVTPPAEPMPRSGLQTDYASWKPREFSSNEVDARSPIIDLDLAFSPFEAAKKSPTTQGRGFSVARKTMHSSGFASSGLAAIHRRTESAPALVPFELCGTLSNNASIQMADVFEEEEEEDTDSMAIDNLSASPPNFYSNDDDVIIEEEEVSNVGVQIVESDNVDETAQSSWDFDNALGIHEDTTIRDDKVFQPKPSETVIESNETIEVVEDYEEPRTSSLTRSSESTITPPLEAREVKEHQPVMTLSLPQPQQSLMTPDTFTNSSISSPGFSDSQTSFDAPRLGTAASSVTDRTHNSGIFGEPGPEFRISSEVPSLTSSRSTMTSGLPHGLIAPRPCHADDRASSISSVQSTMSEKRRKRASIASLSRLMGNSFGAERSKLSIVERPVSEHLETSSTKEKKVKKAKRLSKLMQFWKSKESPARH